MVRVPVTEARLSRWQQISAWPVIVLSFAYIAVYVAPIYLYPLHLGLVTTCHVAECSIWAVFIIDCVVQLSLAVDKFSPASHRFFAIDASSA